MKIFRFWFPCGYIDAKANNIEDAKNIGLFTISNGEQFACFHVNSAYMIEELKD